MVYITQLIFINEKEAHTFHEYEKKVLSLLSRYGGELHLRVRPCEESIIFSSFDRPYEVHIVSFPSKDDFNAYLEDKDRKTYLHLKSQSIKTTFQIMGDSF